MDITDNIVTVIKCLAYDIQLAEWPLNFVSDLSLASEKQRPLIIQSVLNITKYMVGSNIYFLTNYGLTRAEINTLYDLAIN
jgi:hypothetical protein